MVQNLSDLIRQTLSRAVNFLYTKETRSSFALEGEVPSSAKAERFVRALRETAQFVPSKSALLALQGSIVDPRYAAEDWRSFQNYVGESTRNFGDYVHFICPKPQDVPSLMQGWLELTQGAAEIGDAVVAAALNAFAFVFIHPFEDGNGRIHRYLIHHFLSKLGFKVVPVFLDAGRECYMRANVRMYNPGINTVRLDGLTLTSHNPTWGAEVDRFEYRPNPGNVMAPRSGQDVRFNSVLLKANGNQAAWSYNWALNWNYTFWRPSSPGFPLSEAVALEAPGIGAASSLIRGNAEGRGATDEGRESNGNGMALRQSNGVSMGDSVTVDREARTITIVVK